MKRQLELANYLRPQQLNIGDKVIFIDGSSVTNKDFPDESVYIVNDFNGMLSNNLKELDCTGALNHIYKQDTLVEVEGYQFYTHSSMVEKVNK